jgi:TPR repeat protein
LFRFGELEKNYTKAMNYYKRVITSSTEESFYIAHAYFNLGMMNQFGSGIDKNYTKSMRYYNLSATYEPNAIYPGSIMKYLLSYEDANIYQLVINKISDSFFFFTSGTPLIVLGVSILAYILFLISLYSQKE